MDNLEERQLDLVSGARYDSIAKRSAGFPRLVGQINDKYAALQAIDSGAAAALLIAVGNGFSIIDEIGKTYPHHTAHPLISNNTSTLSIVDGVMAVVAVGLAALIWFMEWTWAVWIIVGWSIIEASHICPLLIYDHVYFTRLFFVPFVALVLSLNALRGTQARRRGFASTSTTKSETSLSKGS